MDNAKELIDIIDKRIDAYLKNSNCLRRYSGTVTGQLDEKSYNVQLLGYDTIYTFPIRGELKPTIGDSVFIESKINNLSSGVITDIIGG